MPQKYLLITRPFYENPTNYLFHWSKEIIDLAKSRGINVIDLLREKAKRKELEGRLRKVKPNLVVFNGHGSESSIFGQDGEALIVSGENEKLLEGKIVYARSCLSAKKLGMSCVKSGTKAYIGYLEDFIFIIDRDFITKPLEDKTAALFLQPSNQTIRSLVKGNTAEQANESGKAAFIKNIFRLLTSESSKEDSETVRYLIWDLKHQVCLGNKDAVM